MPGSLSRGNADRDHANMLRVVHRHRDLIGRRAVRRWEAELYWLWAAAHLNEGRPADALRPALRRLLRQPLSPVAWWVAGKAAALSALDRKAPAVVPGEPAPPPRPPAPAPALAASDKAA